MAICSRKDVINSLSFVPFIFNIFKWEASPSTLTFLPGSANTGVSEKLGKTMVSVDGEEHGIS